MTDVHTECPKILLINRCLILNDENKILLIKRAANDSYFPNQWEFPGGKVDEGQNLAEAREREVFEETGLSISLVYPLVYADSYIVGEGRHKGITYVGLFGIAKPIEGKINLSNEHSDYAWVTYEEAQTHELTPETKRALGVLKEYARI